MCHTSGGGGGGNVDKTLLGEKEITNYLGELGISGRKNMDLKGTGCKDLGFSQLVQDSAQLLGIVKLKMSSWVTNCSM
jgi:hypothetical protein